MGKKDSQLMTTLDQAGAEAGALLDSCVWIAIEKAEIERSRVDRLLDLPIRTSPTVMAELKFGVESAKNPLARQSRQAMLDKATRYDMLPINYEVAMQFGMLSAHLHQLGKARGRVQDLWIASTAIVHNVSLATLNARDFADIPNLKLIVL